MPTVAASRSAHRIQAHWLRHAAELGGLLNLALTPKRCQPQPPPALASLVAGLARLGVASLASAQLLSLSGLRRGLLLVLALALL